jgi:hypothetical protein
VSLNRMFSDTVQVERRTAVPDDVIRDQNGRRFAIDGEPDFQHNPSGRLKLTVIRLRTASDL